MRRLAAFVLALLLPSLASAQATLGSQVFAESAASETVVALPTVDEGAAVRVIIVQTSSGARTYDVAITGETPVLRRESATCGISGRCLQVWEDFNVAAASSLSITVTQSDSHAPYGVLAVEINCVTACSGDGSATLFNSPATTTHFAASASEFSSSVNAYVTSACVSAPGSSFGTVTAKSGWTVLDDTMSAVIAQGIASAGALSFERGEMTSGFSRESYCVMASTKDSGTAPDETAPVPGNTGTLTTASVTETGFILNWTKAADAVSAEANLDYRVYRSNTNNIGTVATAEANGTLLQDWTADIATYNVTGLTLATTYWVNVIVRDEADNRAAYTQLSQATASDTTAPTVVTLTPADNAVDVSTTTNLDIVFSENIVKGTGNITIKRTSDNATIETIDVTGVLVTVSLATASINPSVTLANNIEYYVLIDATAFDDTSANSYAGIASTTAWSFTTIAASPGRPPQQPLSMPPALARGVYDWLRGVYQGGTTDPPPSVPLTVNTLSLAQCEVGTPYAQTLSASGGVAPHTWAVLTGVLPAGLSLSSAGAITGDCTTAGISELVFRVTDAESTTQDSNSLSITVVGPGGDPTPLTIVGTGTIHNATRGQAYSKTFSCAGGVPPCDTWSIADGALLTGLSLNASTGVVTGTCTVNDQVTTFTIQAVDSDVPANVAGLTVEDHRCVDPTDITSHTYYETLLTYPELSVENSMRTQAKLDAIKKGSGSAAPYWTYVYPGALLPSDCYNGVCNDTYAVPLDGAKLTLPPEACEPKLDITRVIDMSVLGDGSISRVLLTQTHGMNHGDIATVVISGHVGSTPDINGSHTATAINLTGIKAFDIPVNITVAGSGGTVFFDQCDCTTEGQERCKGASDSLPGPSHLEIEFQGADGPLGVAAAVGTIATSNATTDVWETTAPHNLVTGDRVRVTGHVGATLSDNVHNVYNLVTVTGATTFTFADPDNTLLTLDVEVGGTGGTVTKATGTDSILFTLDVWHSPEIRERNICNGFDDPVEWCAASDAGKFMIANLKTFNIRQGSGGRGWTSPQVSLNEAAAAEEVSTVQHAIGTPAPGVSVTDGMYPTGGKDGVTPGCSAHVYDARNGPTQRLPVHHSKWTRFMWEIRMNVDASDPDWDCWKSLPNAAGLWGKWHMLSMWIIDEDRDALRTVYKAPVYTSHVNLDLFDFEFNSSALAPAKTGDWYYYLRNFILLRNYTLPANPEDDPVIFARPVP